MKVIRPQTLARRRRSLSEDRIPLHTKVLWLTILITVTGFYSFFILSRWDDSLDDSSNNASSLPVPTKSSSPSRGTDQAFIASSNELEVNSDPALVLQIRILGNDLPPLHGNKQSATNLEYILRNEPRFPGWKRMWILNRIISESAEERLRKMILRGGHSNTDIISIPFNWNEAAAECADREDKYQCYIDYTTNVNGARNEALRIARGESGLAYLNPQHDIQWVLLLDGQQFMTWESYASIQTALRRDGAAESADVLGLSMYRLRASQSTEWLHQHTELKTLLSTEKVVRNTEPQVMIRTQSRFEFDEEKGFGKDSKVSFLRAVCPYWDSPAVQSTFSIFEWVRGTALQESSEREVDYALRHLHRRDSADGEELILASAPRNLFETPGSLCVYGGVTYRLSTHSNGIIDTADDEDDGNEVPGTPIVHDQSSAADSLWARHQLREEAKSQLKQLLQYLEVAPYGVLVNGRIQ